MSPTLSPNTQAILLLTAPLLLGSGRSAGDPLTLGEYRRLALLLRERQMQPADLLSSDWAGELGKDPRIPDPDRLKRLLARGFLLSQAVERWRSRAIWVVSRADPEYPRRLKARLKEEAPPVLYGCGDPTIVDSGGLAVVGSRQVDDTLVAYTEEVGRLAARAGRSVVSGGARGIDQAAMRGALEAGGKAVGVLADSLEKAAVQRENRNFLMDGQLVLLSPYDPAAGFNVGHAMQRNKLIYALADAALVVNADFEKGGTWAGAVEQLEKLRLVPVYVRAGQTVKGLEALRQRGAMPWTDPDTSEAWAELLAVEHVSRMDAASQSDLFPSSNGRAVESPQRADLAPEPPHEPQSRESAEELLALVKGLLIRIMTAPRTETEVADDLGVLRSQAKEWLERLVDEGVMEKHYHPVRYGPKVQASLLK